MCGAPRRRGGGVLEVAIYRAPRAPRSAGRRVLSPAAQRHVAEAMRVLAGEAPGLAGDEALAERERYRREQAAQAEPQAVLPLVPAPTPRGRG
jgi:hypothetical protein